MGDSSQTRGIAEAKEGALCHTFKADGKGSAGAFCRGGISGSTGQPGRADTGRLLCFCRWNHRRKFLIEREEKENVE